MRPAPPVAVAMAAAVALVLGGCTADGGTTPSPGPVASTPVEEPTPEPTPALEPWTSVIATATDGSVEVYADPGATTAEQTVSAADVLSLPDLTPLTFLVVAQEDDWVQVDLPVAPGGSTGWLRAQEVTLATTDYRIEVRLGEHRLLLHDADQVVLDVPVGIGVAEAPGAGTYFVKELLQPPHPGGPYGVYAYGLSGYPPVLQSFAAGRGVVGIHGTDQPELVGTDAPNGGIRMLDADVTRLVEEFGLPLGTPVEVTA